MTVRARLIIGDGNRDFPPIDGVHEGDFDAINRIIPLSWPASRTSRRSPSAAEEALEDVIQIDIAKSFAREAAPKGVARPTGRGAIAESGKAELVVLAALIIVIEDVIRLLDLFEFLRGVRRVVDVRMVFLREFAVGAFDFVFGRAKDNHRRHLIK